MREYYYLVPKEGRFACFGPMTKFEAELKKEEMYGDAEIIESSKIQPALLKLLEDSSMGV